MAEFVHLHNHSDFSLLDGAASVGSMVARAKALGMRGPRPDRPRQHVRRRRNSTTPARTRASSRSSGVEFYVAGGSRLERTGTENGNKYWHLVLLAKNEEGYRNLLKLSSASYTEGFYYKPRIDFELLAAHAEGAHRQLGLHRGRDPEPRCSWARRPRPSAWRCATRSSSGQAASTSSCRTTASPSRRPRTRASWRWRGGRACPSSARTTCTTSSAPTPRPTTSCSASARTASATSRGGCASTGPSST